MAYILILVFLGGSPGVPHSSSTAEFSSQEACRAAAKEVTWASVTYCVKKG